MIILLARLRSLALGALLLLTSTTLVPSAGAQPAPPKVIGCEITIDIGKTVNCLHNAVDREVRDAERAIRTVADGQIGNLQTQLQGAQRELATAKRTAAVEVAKAEAASRAAMRGVEGQLQSAQTQLTATQQQVAQLQQQLANNAFMAQLQWQRALLTEIKTQEALFNCLAAGNVDIARMIQEFSANPGTFAQARVQEVIRTTTAEFPKAMQAELTNLSRGLATSSGDRAVLVRRGTDVMFRVGDQIPSARCLLQSIPPQLRAQIEGAIGGVINEAERQAQTIVNQHILPAARAGIASQLRGGYDSIVKVVPSPIPTINQEIEKRVPFLQGLTLSEREMRAVARGVLLERQFDMFTSSTDAIQSLARTVATANAPAAGLEQARSQVARALRGTADYDQLYASIGVELMRAIGHKYIDSENVGHGGFLLTQGFGLLQLSSGTTQNLVDGLCGLIPEVGGVICAYVMQYVITAWNGLIVPQLRSEVANVLHLAMDTSVDKVRDELKKNVKLADIRSRLGPADALIAAIPSEALLAAWANGFIDRDIKNLERFSDSVLTLSNASTQRL